VQQQEIEAKIQEVKKLGDKLEVMSKSIPPARKGWKRHSGAHTWSRFS